MYNKKQQDIYYLHKLLISLMFDNNHESYKQVSWLYDIAVLEVFENIVKKFVENGCFTENIKNNIYTILLDGREVKDEDYEKRVEILNRITIILNSQTYDKSIFFYRKQLEIRLSNYKEFSKYTLQDIVDEIPYIEESIYGDALVLLSHSKDISDEIFAKEYFSDFVENSYYYESLNAILFECPSFFEDELFVRRVNQILKYNKKTKRYFKSTHKNVKTLIKNKLY